MSNLKKCAIERYDETIKEPPFLTIKLDETEVLEPVGFNDMGEEFARRLAGACEKKGYRFKFYSISKEEDFDYKIVVWNESGLV